jgi:DNA-directed RNA polymerase subunit RPC12/RpoP
MRFMMGRYGADNLNRFLLGVSIVLIVLSAFTRWALLDLLGVAVLIYCYFRMFSKNIPKRYQENQKYLKLKAKVTGVFRKNVWYAKQRKTHHIYTCPSCGQKIRIPKGKGRIQVTCPKCKHTFIKNS